MVNIGCKYTPQMYYIRISRERITNPAFGFVAELMQLGEGPIKVLAKSLSREKVVSVAVAEAEKRGLAINPSLRELRKMAEQ